MCCVLCASDVFVVILLNPFRSLKGEAVKVSILFLATNATGAKTC